MRLSLITPMRCGLFVCLVAAGGWTGPGRAAEDQEPTVVPEGHSYHGEAFNEGPRQHAHLMSGLGRSRFEVTTSCERAQAFFNQGIDQLHGFWYYEAERSFRQVVQLDPDCALAYWGLAMANINNETRAREFIAQAEQKSEQPELQISEREQAYIRSLATYYDDQTGSDKARAIEYVKQLEELVLKYPEDVEAKAFLACQIWMNTRAGIKITSHVSVDALLEQVFDHDPDHPAHHYRIHLWDYRKPEAALQSASRCGNSLPDIAHMWHMPGHIYSRLHRYQDAVWQQEASARVDHRHMMRDWVLPDQIHNYAHNNEWCIRNLIHVGRVQDAIDLAVNMISLPRHPRYNTLQKRGSASYGRQRLIEVLSTFELWEQARHFADAAVLPPTDDPLQQIHRLGLLGRAHYRSGQLEPARQVLQQLRDAGDEADAEKKRLQKIAREEQQVITDRQRQLIGKLAAHLPADVQRYALPMFRRGLRREHRQRTDDAVKQAVADIEKRSRRIRQSIDELNGHDAIATGDLQAGLEKLRQSELVDPAYCALIELQAGRPDSAIRAMEDHVAEHENEVQPLAMLAWLVWQADEKDRAVEALQQLRDLSGAVDMQSPVFTRLSVIAEHAGLPDDWRSAQRPAEDFGERPDLASLGPFRWQPVPAPTWNLTDENDQSVSLNSFRGQPVLLIFYLGHGCLHCAEQLQKFAPQVEAFRQAGIEVVAISTDDHAGLQQSIRAYGPERLPIRLLADPQQNVFRAYRAYDEFEDQPLHGTYLIDGDGDVRWLDISYEPFMDCEFLLQESRRLLSQAG